MVYGMYAGSFFTGHVTVVLKTLVYTCMDGPMHEILTFIAYALKSVLKVVDV